MTSKCEACNYMTKNKFDFKKHLKTKKHIKNSIAYIPKNSKINTGKSEVHDAANIAHQNSPKLAKPIKNQDCDAFKCKYCDGIFKRLSNLNRHAKTCYRRTDIKEKELHGKDKLIDFLKLQLNMQKKETSIYKSEREFYVKESEYYKDLISNYTKFGHKNFNSITYVLNKYGDAPHIEKTEPEKLECFKDVDMKTMENIISDYRNKVFVEFAVKMIINLHKKDDPTKQSIWSTDTSRYNYVIKELLENEGSYWIIDKKGIKSKNYIVEPILDFIRKEIIGYNELVGKAILDKNLPKERFSIIMDTQKDGIDMIKDIDNGIIGKEIIKRMATHLYHKTDTPQIEEIEDSE